MRVSGGLCLRAGGLHLFGYLAVQAAHAVNWQGFVAAFVAVAGDDAAIRFGMAFACLKNASIGRTGIAISVSVMNMKKLYCFL